MNGSALRIFPLSPDGSAIEGVLPAGRLMMVDLTSWPRFGIKGPGSSKWLDAQGLRLPQVNRIARQRGIKLIRLGGEDFLVVDDAPGKTIIDLTAAWGATVGSRGYWSWREEGWSWMRLSGPLTEAVMARLCGLDLRRDRFGEDEVAQTRVGHLEAVLLRSKEGYDVFFDIAATAFFIRTVTAAATFAAGEATVLEKHR